MALWVILGLDLMSAHHRMEHKITKNFLSLILSSPWSALALGWQQMRIINKEFPGRERARERERREYLFLKIDEIFCIKFHVRKKLAAGSDVRAITNTL